MSKKIFFLSCVIILCATSVSAQPDSSNLTKGGVTLIDVFQVSPETQQKVADILIQLSDQLIKNQPGYVSATIYQSTDGMKVINIGKWKTEDDFQAMLKNSEITGLIRQAAGLAESFEPSMIVEVYDDRKE